MTDLPELEPIEARKVELRWQKLIEAHKFTGEHLYWQYSLQKRQQLERSFAGPLGSRREVVYYIGDREIKSGDPQRVDLIGCDETALLAVELFNVLGEAYYCRWSGSGNVFDEFVRWMSPIEKQVISHLRSLWNGRGDWFDRAVPGLLRHLP